MPHIYGLKIQFTKEMDKANFVEQAKFLETEAGVEEIPRFAYNNVFVIH
jgi:hypothetical protein